MSFPIAQIHFEARPLPSGTPFDSTKIVHCVRADLLVSETKRRMFSAIGVVWRHPESRATDARLDISLFPRGNHISARRALAPPPVQRPVAVTPKGVNSGMSKSVCGSRLSFATRRARVRLTRHRSTTWPSCSLSPSAGSSPATAVTANRGWGRLDHDRGNALRARGLSGAAGEVPRWYHVQ